MHKHKLGPMKSKSNPFSYKSHQRNQRNKNLNRELHIFKELILIYQEKWKITIEDKMII